MVTHGFRSSMPELRFEASRFDILWLPNDWYNDFDALCFLMVSEIGSSSFLLFGAWSIMYAAFGGWFDFFLWL